jgi:hypothetical protein
MSRGSVDARVVIRDATEPIRREESLARYRDLGVIRLLRRLCRRAGAANRSDGILAEARQAHAKR